jgi:ribosomal 50S subunit-recycling heat shock protein
MDRVAAWGCCSVLSRFPAFGKIRNQDGGLFMRLDKYLKVSRLIKRRSVANEACDATRVTANGRPVKASYQVKVGDILEIKFGEKTLKVEVLVVADNVGKNDAAAMYREVL